MVVHTLQDIVGPLTAKPIVADPNLTAKWILFNASTSGGGTSAVVCGLDDKADATHGAHLQPNVPVLYPQNPTDPTDVYQLSQMQAYVPSGTTLTVTYGS